MSTFQSVTDRSRQLSPRVLMAILAILSVALYANTIGHGFVLDDYAVLLKHRLLAKGFAGIPEILKTPYWQGYSTGSNDLYRPLPLVVFAVQRGLFGTTPLPGHIVNILLFAGCVLLLFKTTLRLFGRDRMGLAFLAALLFAVHPVHTEVVANIKSCDELLCFAFSLSAILAALRYLETGKRIALAGMLAAYFLALLSKETAIFLVLIAPLIAWRYRQTARAHAIAVSAGFAIAAAVYLFIRSRVLGAYQTTPFHPTLAENALASATTAAARLPHSLTLLGHYLKLLFIPNPLISDYSYTTLPLPGWRSPAPWISLAAYLGLAGVAIYRAFMRRGDAIAFGILFFLAGIALFSNLVFLIGTTFAERFLFLPSAGFCIAVAALVMPKANSGATIRDMLPLRNGGWLVCSAAVVFAVLTVSRNAAWASEERLFAADMPKAPYNYRIPYYWSTYYMLQIPETGANRARRQELMSKAVPLLLRSIANYDGYLPARAQLANIYLEIGPQESGLAYGMQAIEENPRDTFTRNNIAAYYFRKGEYRTAAAFSRMNIAIDSQYFLAHANLGACLLKMNQPDSALVVLRRAWSLRPGNKRTGYFLKVAFDMMGQGDSAARYAAFSPM